MLIRKLLKSKLVRQKIKKRNLFFNYSNYFFEDFILIPIYGVRMHILHNVRVYLKKYSYNIRYLKLSFFKLKTLSNSYLRISNINNITLIELMFFIFIIENNNLYFNLNTIGYYQKVTNKIRLYSLNSLKKDIIYYNNIQSEFKIIQIIENKINNLIKVLINYILYLIIIIKNKVNYAKLSTIN